MKYLHLKGIGITDHGLRHLAGMKNLLTLTLDYNLRVTSAGLKYLEHLSRLTDLSLNKCDITDDGLASVGQIQRLDSLELNGTPITSVGLAHLEQLSGLGTLALADTQVDDAGVCSLARIEFLHDLDLSGCTITGSGLRSCRELRALKLDRVIITDSLLDELQQLPLLTLSLNGSNIDNEDLRTLASIPNLRELSICNCPIDDSAIEILNTFPELALIVVTKGTLSEQGTRASNRIHVSWWPD